MFFFQRTKHKLPKFPPTVAATFRSLCEDIPAEEAMKLRDEVLICVDEAREREKSDPRTDLNSTIELANCCKALLDRYENFSSKQRALVIGAVRYFAGGNDPLSDEDFASGLWDDKRVMNYVLEQLGVEDMFLKV